MNLADNLSAQFQRIATMHPQLLDAVPPEPIERRNGTFSLNVAEFWNEFCAREWQPRPGRDENLIGPFHMYGECLDPYMRSGELHWYDPTIPARDGDIVLVQWAPEVLEDMYARNAGDAAWMRQYGEPAPVATKIYKTVGRNQWLLTRKSMLPLGANRILGVLRKRLCVDRVPAIEPDAATSVAETTAAGPVNISSIYRGIYLVVGDYPVDCEIIVTSSARFVMNISAAAACELRGVIDVGGFASPGSGDLLASNPGNVTGNVKGSYSLENRFTLTAGGVSAYYMNLLPSFAAPAHIGSSVDLYDIRHKCEVIKR
jgi:hypothetical protein